MRTEPLGGLGPLPGSAAGSGGRGSTLVIVAAPSAPGAMSWELPAPATGVEPVGVAPPAVEVRTASTEVPGVKPELTVGALEALVAVVVAEEVIGDEAAIAGAVAVPSAPEPTAEDVSTVVVVTAAVVVVATAGIDTGTDVASTVVVVVVVVVVDGTELRVVDDAVVVDDSVVAPTGAEELVESADAVGDVEADPIGADEVSAELTLEASADVELDSLGAALVVESADGVLVPVAGAEPAAVVPVSAGVVDVPAAFVPATCAGAAPAADPFVSLGP